MWLLLLGYAWSCTDPYGVRNGTALQGRCLIAYPELSLNYSMALHYCRTVQVNATLPRVLSAVESEWVRQELPRLSQWIGLSGSDPWVWSDGAPLNESVYEHWAFLEPAGDGACVELWQSGEGIWNDVPCSTQQSFSCEFPLYTCGDIPYTDPQVCSGQGICLMTDVCQCLGCTQGPLCEQGPQCGPYMANESDVCHDRGSCVACEQCQCRDEGSIGHLCGELWSPVLFDTAAHRMVLTVETQDPLLWNGSCKTLLWNTTTVLGEHPHCSWRSNNTILLQLDPPYIIEPTQTLCFRPITEISVDISDCVCVQFAGTPSSDKTPAHTTGSGLWWLAIVIPTLLCGLLSVYCVLGLCCGISPLIFIPCSSCGCCSFLYTRWIYRKSNRDRVVKRMEEDLMMVTLSMDENTYNIPLQTSTEAMRICIEDLKVESLIASGGSAAQVFRARWKGMIVAYKCFRLGPISGEDSLSDTPFLSYIQELSFSIDLKHEHICTFYGYTLYSDKECNRVGFIMEYCEHGDLRSYLSEHRPSNRKRIEFLRDIVSAIAYMHHGNIIHRDLKLDNVLVTKNRVVKLIDFGLSKRMGDQLNTNTARIGTSYYMPPEITRGEKYDRSCDIYSFAIMAHEILTGDLDFARNLKEQYHVEYHIACNPQKRPRWDLLDWEDPFWIQHLPLRALLTRGWNDDPAQRPTIEEFTKYFDTE